MVKVRWGELAIHCSNELLDQQLNISLLESHVLIPDILFEIVPTKFNWIESESGRTVSERSRWCAFEQCGQSTNRKDWFCLQRKKYNELDIPRTPSKAHLLLPAAEAEPSRRSPGNWSSLFGSLVNFRLPGGKLRHDRSGSELLMPGSIDKRDGGALFIACIKQNRVRFQKRITCIATQRFHCAVFRRCPPSTAENAPSSYCGPQCKPVYQVNACGSQQCWSEPRPLGDSLSNGRKRIP